MSQLTVHAQNWTHRKAHANLVSSFSEFPELLFAATMLLIHMNKKETFFLYWWGSSNRGGNDLLRKGRVI